MCSGSIPPEENRRRNLRGQGGVQDQLQRVVLMAGAAGTGLARPLRHPEVGDGWHDRFGRVREGRVAQVVKQDREAQRLAEARPVVRAQRKLRRHRIEDLGGHRHGAETMGVTGVRGTWERQVREPELLHVPESLVLRAVDQRPLVGRQLDRSVDGVADVHGLGLSSPGFDPCFVIRQALVPVARIRLEHEIPERAW